jgi:hypothetical protein
MTYDLVTCGRTIRFTKASEIEFHALLLGNGAKEVRFEPMTLG